MKRFTNIMYIILILTNILISCDKKKLTGPNGDFPVLIGPYLGQTPPGMAPELFAPEIFNQEVHSTAVFSSDGTELYWNLMSSNQIFFMKIENNEWSSPQEVPFALSGGTGDPALSHDGNKLFFTSFHPIEGTSNKENIWYVERSENEWLDPKPLGSAVNELYMHWQHSVASNGNLYFSADNDQDNKDIYISEFINGEFIDPVCLSKSINTPNSESCPFVAPDERYLIFDRHGGNIGFADLFISFKNSDSSWCEAINMGGIINSGGNETCPFVTYDQKYLFFIRNDNSGDLRIFWVDAQVIEEIITDADEVDFQLH